MVKNYRLVCTAFNYIRHLLTLASTIIGCVSISVFASFVGIPIAITNSAVGLSIYEIAARTKECKSRIKKKRKKDNKIVSLPKTKLNSTEVIISKALINSYTTTKDKIFEESSGFHVK